MKRLKRIGLVLLLVFGLSSALAAQDPMVLLEKAIYTEETLGNLNEAIGLYQKVAADVNATRATSALALFRLGMCYQKSRNDDQAQSIFSKLIKLYPEQSDLIALIPAPAANPLGLKPAPWADGEILQLSAKTKGGVPMGTVSYRFESSESAGKRAWRLQSNIGFRSINMSALIDAATFTPFSSVVQEGSNWRIFRAKYGLRQIEFSMTVDGESGEKTFPLTRVAYDELQLVQFLRCLPLYENYQIAIPIFSVSNYIFLDAKLEVVGRDRVTVPAGTFNCYKVVVTKGNQSPSSTYWVSDDIHSYIVKAQEDRVWGAVVHVSADLELASIGNVNQ